MEVEQRNSTVGKAGGSSNEMRGITAGLYVDGNGLEQSEKMRKKGRISGTISLI